MTLGDIIRTYRAEHKMSMDAFSEKSGISKAYISLLEKNKHPKTGKPIAPSIQCIKQAADGMNMDFNLLFSQIDEDIQVSLIDIDHVDAGLIEPADSNDGFYSRISTYYNKLNDIGKQEAFKRLEELTQIPKYIDEPLLDAAHAISGASEEDKQFDEDIMDAEDF